MKKAFPSLQREVTRGRRKGEEEGLDYRVRDYNSRFPPRSNTGKGEGGGEQGGKGFIGPKQDTY